MGYGNEEGDLVVPFLYQGASAFKFENGVARVYDEEFRRFYVDWMGNRAVRREDLPGYDPPALESVKSNGMFLLSHRDGGVREFHDLRYLDVYEDGCATCVTKDCRGGFSQDPLREDSWVYFPVSERALVYYDTYSKIISCLDFIAKKEYYLTTDGSMAELLETAARRYYVSQDCEHGRVRVVTGVKKTPEGQEDSSEARWGALSSTGKEIVSCAYDDVEIDADYIRAWKYDEEHETSDVSFFSDTGALELRLTVDGHRHGDGVPFSYWYPFKIGGTNYWINVKDKKALYVENDRIVSKPLRPHLVK
ncbi:MAG: WG repeat-containing protein [Kiritimatiellia bacterium]